MIRYYYKLLDIKEKFSIPKLLTDSQSAMKLANNPEFHKRTKHIDISYHFIRNVVKYKHIELKYNDAKSQKS